MPRWQRFLFGLVLAAGLAVVAAALGGLIGSRTYDGPSGFDALAYVLGAVMVGGLTGLVIGIFIALRARTTILKACAAVFGAIGLALIVLVMNARYQEMEEARQEQTPPSLKPTAPAPGAEDAGSSGTDG